jgi:hypothetical protein
MLSFHRHLKKPRGGWNVRHVSKNVKSLVSFSCNKRKLQVFLCIRGGTVHGHFDEQRLQRNPLPAFAKCCGSIEPGSSTQSQVRMQRGELDDARGVVSNLTT